MKKTLLILIMFLLIPGVLAGISVTLDKSEFNLGDKLSASALILEENDIEGFFRVSIVCDNKTFEYYATPISLRANINKNIDIPDFALFEELLGECYLDFVIKSQKEYIIDEAPSALFTVSNALNIFLSKSSFTANPGEEINIQGSVKKIYDVNVDKANVTLILDNKTIPFTVRNGIIDYSLKIPSDIKSYTHFISIIAQDKYGNKGKEVIQLEINPIPTIIETELNKDLFIPSETLEIRIKLLDQANDLMDGIINFEIINPDNGKIYMQTASSDSTLSYTFEMYAMPGKYRLRSFLNDVLAEDIVTMQEYEKLKATLEGDIIYIENIGNIDYNKKNVIILEDDKNNEYIIQKKIKLRPGEFMTIDLSKEVPEGNYKVELPEGIIEDVPIEDNRGFLKKTEQGISKITGSIVGTSDKALMTPFMASIILIAIVLTLIIVANKDKIKRLFKRD